jgi:hypothetical protein
LGAASLNSTVYAIAISGTDVYVSGNFTNADGIANADYIAKWDGSVWSALGEGLNARCNSIALYGDDVYCGGTFTTAGGRASLGIAAFLRTLESVLVYLEVTEQALQDSIVTQTNPDIPVFIDKTAFTPAIAGSTVAGVGTYVSQLGIYSKIGNCIFLAIEFNWTAHTGTGDMLITGLPFTSTTSIVQYIPVHWNSVTLLAVGNKILSRFPGLSTTVTLQEIGSGAATNLPLDTGGYMRLSGFYFI